MRFQNFFSIPFLVAALAPALALPVASSDLSSYETRNLEDDKDLLVRDSFDIEEREASEDLSIRSLLESLVPRDKTYKLKAPVVKKTAEQAKQRKDQVRSDVAAKQAANKIKKAELQQKFKDLGEPKYGKPRKVGKPNEPGYRARSRAGGFRLPKQPKTPKPDMVKGMKKDLRPAKARKTQQEALDRKHARLAAGRAKFGPAAAAHKATIGLPGRKDTFQVPGEHTYTGKDVRIANFNNHLFKSDRVGETPKEFQNRLQGPPNARTRPLPHMNGVGQEFPLTAGQRGGYQGGEKSAARLITQDHPGAPTKFAGVIAHDVSLQGTGHPGENDHFQVHPTVGNGGTPVSSATVGSGENWDHLPFHS